MAQADRLNLARDLHESANRVSRARFCVRIQVDEQWTTQEFSDDASDS